MYFIRRRLFLTGWICSPAQTSRYRTSSCLFSAARSPLSVVGHIHTWKIHDAKYIDTPIGYNIAHLFVLFKIIPIRAYCKCMCIWLPVGTVAEASAAVHLAATHLIRQTRSTCLPGIEEVTMLLPTILYDLCCRAEIITTSTSSSQLPCLLLRMMEADDDAILYHWLHNK